MLERAHLDLSDQFRPHLRRRIEPAQDIVALNVGGRVQQVPDDLGLVVHDRVHGDEAGALHAQIGVLQTHEELVDVVAQQRVDRVDLRHDRVLDRRHDRRPAQRESQIFPIAPGDDFSQLRHNRRRVHERQFADALSDDVADALLGRIAVLQEQVPAPHTHTHPVNVAVDIAPMMIAYQMIVKWSARSEYFRLSSIDKANMI